MKTASIRYRLTCRRKLAVILFFVLQMSFEVPPAHAMDLPHYDLDSLVYLSTDIVVVTLSEDAEGNFSGTVVETLYGPLRSGDRVERLKPFLSFFRPIEGGMKVVLFLDRRPRQYDFIHQDAAKSPFAVVPSGVLMVDKYDHVHRYLQTNNPGPYVAQGYEFFIEKKVPTQEEDMKLPSLQQERELIAASLKRVGAMRPELDKTATRDDVAALLALLRIRAETVSRCSIGMWEDAIAARINQQIGALNDPDLLLTLYSFHTDWAADVKFIQQDGNRDRQFTAGRVQYLIRTLGDRKKDLTHRLAAAEILASLARFHSTGQTGVPKSWLIDNEWLTPSVSQIRDVAKKVFDDKTADPELRSVCLRLLPLDDEKMEKNVRSIYARSHSAELRYAIEKGFLEVSDAEYESLKPRGGPVASIVMRAPPYRCANPDPGKPAFVAKYHQTKAAHDQWEVFQTMHITLTNLRTGERIPEVKTRQYRGWSGAYDGEMWFELRDEGDLPPGEYSLGVEYRKGTKVVSAGYKLELSVIHSADGTEIEVH